MSNRRFIGSRRGSARDSQVSARDSQMRMAHVFDLNFPPPDQNAVLASTYMGSSASDHMEAEEHGQSQLRFMDNVRVNVDEISRIAPTVFSEERKNRLGDRQGIQMGYGNMGVYRGNDQMMNTDMEVYNSYAQMWLNGGNMQACHGYENSELRPIMPPFSKRTRTGQFPPEYIDFIVNGISGPPPPGYMDYLVNGIAKDKNVPASPEEPDQSEAPPEAFNLNCPICLSELCEETSTKCGHIFCKICIETAITVQHKCPTCRHKLRKNDIIRIYLPRST